ncbi:MAG TPA: alpha/beta fold hydrolase [Myxococcota bacterium]|nr:alpha/beta fold hydrolase [Myxococcota bacterium]HRY92182.1 alpha/beta fold hydrolase [Myxococcota bacterium]HSA21719.1 alpha/beta fold hydrolase [Myxococcota bacterium]
MLARASMRRVELGGVPAWLVWLGDAREAGRRGAVLHYHGFGADALRHLPELRRLARAGFLAVGVDAVGHGTRRFPDFEARFAAHLAEQGFHEVVERSVAEVPGIVDALVAEGLSDGARLGLAGVSMGGFIAYGAALRERRLRAVVALLASPVWPGFGERSPHAQAARFPPVALLSQLAGGDELVRPGPARELHARLAPLYAAHPERLRLVEFPGAPHLMPPRPWRQAVMGMVAWLERFVPEAPPGSA